MWGYRVNFSIILLRLLLGVDNGWVRAVRVQNVNPTETVGEIRSPTFAHFCIRVRRITGLVDDKFIVRFLRVSFKKKK